MKGRVLIIDKDREYSERLRDELRVLGCSLAQGFHLARPMPAEDLDAFLAGRLQGAR